MPIKLCIFFSIFINFSAMLQGFGSVRLVVFSIQKTFSKAHSLYIYFFNVSSVIHLCEIRVFSGQIMYWMSIIYRRRHIKVMIKCIDYVNWYVSLIHHVAQLNLASFLSASTDGTTIRHAMSQHFHKFHLNLNVKNIGMKNCKNSNSKTSKRDQLIFNDLGRISFALDLLE